MIAIVGQSCTLPHITIAVTLVRRHNRLQLRRGILDLTISLMATVVTFGFFYLCLSYLFFTFGNETLQQWHLPIVIAVVLLNFVTGYFAWRRGIGQSQYHETDLFMDLGLGVTGGGTMTSLYVARATGPAYFVSQIALAAPLRLFKGIEELRFQVPEDLEFEARLSSLLNTIVEKKRWHSIVPYRELAEEFACLVRLDAVDFSPRKGSVKARSEFVA